MDIEFGGTAYGAIQFGNLAVMAPWLDVTSEHDIRHCFRYTRSEGVLGVLYEEDSVKEYHGIQDRFAILQTEHTEDTGEYAARFAKVTEPLTGRVRAHMDDSRCRLDVVILAAAEGVYRILMRYISDTTRRVIDPVDGMIRLARSLPEVQCKHTDKWNEGARVKDVIKYYTFDDLLTYWQNEDGSPPSHGDDPDQERAAGLTYHITSLLESGMKSNAAKALAVNDLAVVNKGKCCIECALEKARTIPMPSHIGASNEVPDRYIINVGRRESQLARTNKRKIIGGTR